MDEIAWRMREQGTLIVDAILSPVPEFGDYIVPNRDWVQSGVYMALARLYDFAEENAKLSNAEMVKRIYAFAETYFERPEGDTYGDAMHIEMLEPIILCASPPSDHIMLLYTCLGPVGKAIVDRYSDVFKTPPANPGIEM